MRDRPDRVDLLIRGDAAARVGPHAVHPPRVLIHGRRGVPVRAVTRDSTGDVPPLRTARTGTDQSLVEPSGPLRVFIVAAGAMRGHHRREVHAPIDGSVLHPGAPALRIRVPSRDLLRRRQPPEPRTVLPVGTNVIVDQSQFRVDKPLPDTLVTSSYSLIQIIRHVLSSEGSRKQETGKTDLLCQPPASSLPCGLCAFARESRSHP